MHLISAAAAVSSIKTVSKVNDDDDTAINF